MVRILGRARWDPGERAVISWRMVAFSEEGVIEEDDDDVGFKPGDEVASLVRKLAPEHEGHEGYELIVGVAELSGELGREPRSPEYADVEVETIAVEIELAPPLAEAVADIIVTHVEVAPEAGGDRLDLIDLADPHVVPPPQRVLLERGVASVLEDGLDIVTLTAVDMCPLHYRPMPCHNRAGW